MVGTYYLLIASTLFEAFLIWHLKSLKDKLTYLNKYLFCIFRYQGGTRRTHRALNKAVEYFTSSANRPGVRDYIVIFLAGDSCCTNGLNNAVNNVTLANIMVRNIYEIRQLAILKL